MKSGNRSHQGGSYQTGSFQTEQVIVNTSIFEGLGDELFIPIACLVAPSDIHDEAIQTLQSKEIINTQMLQQHRQTIHKTTNESLGPTTSL